MIDLVHMEVEQKSTTQSQGGGNITLMRAMLCYGVYLKEELVEPGPSHYIRNISPLTYT